MTNEGQAVVAIYISGLELEGNRDPEKLAKLVGARTEIAKRTLRELLRERGFDVSAIP